MSLLDFLINIVQNYGGVLFSVLLLILVLLGGMFWHLRSLEKEEHADIVKHNRHLDNLDERWEEGEVAKPLIPDRIENIRRNIENIEKVEESQIRRLPDSSEIFLPVPSTPLQNEIMKQRQLLKEKDLTLNVNESFLNIFEAGKTAISEAKWEQAKKYMEEASKQNPENEEVKINLAIIYYEIGDLRSAQTLYQKLGEQDPLGARSFRKYLASRV